MGGRGSSSRSGKGGKIALGGGFSAQRLDASLIGRANDSSFFYDAGESINTEYKDNVRRIAGLELISDSDKRAAIKRQHELATAALQAQAEAPSWAVTGRANLNVRASNSATQKAMSARGDMTEHVNGLIITSKTNVVAARNNARKIAVENALATGALEFTVNGETWRRSSKRSKTFQAVLF